MFEFQAEIEEKYMSKNDKSQFTDEVNELRQEVWDKNKMVQIEVDLVMEEITSRL